MVIEEPETALHPRAISVVMLLVLDLLSRGYRVCISTHSPHVLDIVWALRVIRENRASADRLLELFEVPGTETMKNMAMRVINKETSVYYFDGATGKTRDISNLDPGSPNAAEAGWGGLSEFSGRVANVVASVINQASERVPA